jgi:hypothetical protein
MSFFGVEDGGSCSRDLATSTVTGVPAMVDALHQPFLEWKARHMSNGGRVGSPPGANALRLWSPNFSELSWETIIGAHDHDAIGAFRSKLLEAEQKVAPLPADQQDEALRDTSAFKNSCAS